MSGHERSHSLDRGRSRSSFRNRDRTPGGRYRRSMEEMMARLRALEERVVTRSPEPVRPVQSSERRSPDRSSERLLPARSSERAPSVRSPEHISQTRSPERVLPPRVPERYAESPARSQVRLLNLPVASEQHAEQIVMTESRRSNKETVSSVTESLVQAIRSIGSSGSGQRFYISNFDPDIHNIDVWCDEVDRAKSFNNWSDNECLSRIGFCLKGDARTWLNEWVTSDRSWSNFKREFKPLCPRTPDFANILFEVMSTNSDKYTTYADYARRSLLRLRVVRGLSDELMSAIVIRGITDPQIRAAATNAKLLPNDLVEFFSIYVKSSSSKSKSNVSLTRGKPENVNIGDIRMSRKRRAEEGLCFSCGLPGHTKAFCKKAKLTSTQNSSSSNSGGALTSKLSEPCSFCKKIGHKVENCFAKQNSESRNKNNVNFCRENRSTLNQDVVAAVIQGVPTDVLIDSGSTISLISSKLLRHFESERKPAFRILKGLGSQEIESTSYVTLPIEFDGITMEVDLYVVGYEYMNTPIIVGTDVLNREGVRYVRTRDSQLLTRDCRNTEHVMAVQSDVTTAINTPLEGEQLQQLLEIVTDYAEHLITGTATSTVNTGSMSIKLNSDTTVNYRPYRLSYDETLRVRDIVKDLVDKGIVRESESEYASPILLVKKKDGSDRMCVDYRKLNDLTIKDRFPLPRIDDHIDRLGQSHYFTSLDMATGFHQIPLDEQSIPLTGFVTPEGHYEYKKMPYGLANAPVVYQRIISKTLREFIESGDVLVYIDDVLILSRTVEDGLILLRKVLGVLTEAGFSINLRKCSFLTQETEYLGRTISRGQVRPSPDKVKALTDAHEPTTVRQVRQFMGLASYFRRYISDFARKTACISALTKKGVVFDWGTQQRAARNYIVECLTNEPVLAIYDPALPIEVHTDASSVGYGAVLLQAHEGGYKRVVAYFSKLTQGAESKYHSYELETLAVVKALQHFRHYLVGVRFTVVTDCNALKLTQRKKDLLPRVIRWWVYLQDFDFSLEYRKGTMMSHADYLSRSPVNVCTVQKPQNWAQIAQAADGETRDLMQKLTDGLLDATRYVVKNDILYAKHAPTGEPSRLLCFIPKGHRLSLLRVFHDEHDHSGVDKTADLILKHFWFPGLRNFVQKYISHCVVCISQKRVPRAPLQPIHSWEKPEIPFDTIHVDALGPLPESSGFRHILIVVDAFSKFCMLYPMYRQDSSELKRHFTNVISLFGTPRLLVADRGRMFQSSDFLEWVRGMGVEVHLITPEMHQANGQVERYCRTVLNMVRVEANYRQHQWPEVIWKVQLVLNITKHRTTQLSALNLLVGIDAATPLIRSLVRDVALQEGDSGREAMREMSRQRASERLRRNQSAQDRYVNERRRPPRTFELDSLVFVSKQAQSTGKLDSGMRGPYRVIKLLPQGRYELRLLSGTYGKSTQAAAEFMVPWHGEWTPDVCATFFDDSETEQEEFTSAAAVTHLDNVNPQPSTSGMQTPAERLEPVSVEKQTDAGASMPLLETDTQS